MMVFFHGYPDISKASSFNLRPFDLVKINIPDLHSLSSEGWKKNHLKFHYSFQEMNLTGLNDLDSIISSNKLLSLTINLGTKMTYPGLSMWDGSLKIHYFMDFWHSFCLRLWKPRMLLSTKSKGHKSNFRIS